MISKIHALLSRLFFKTWTLSDKIFSWNDKQSESLEYRINWKDSTSPAPQKTLWIHGASVGELEDLSSFFLNEELLIESGFSFSRLALSSSSPSAKKTLMKWKKKHSLHFAGALPPESSSEIEKFLNHINPELFILSQSDVWPALFKKSYERMGRKCLWLPHKINSADIFKKGILKDFVFHVGTRKSYSSNILKSTKQSLIGLPRLDRILERIEEQKQKKEHILEKYGCAPDPQKTSLILGSAWKEDAAFISKALNKLSPLDQEKIQLVVIPHETKNSLECAAIAAHLPQATILRKEGLLVEAYQNFDLAFIGGAFRTGLHNILEAICWNIPSFCGPLTKAQPEAVECMEAQYLKRHSVIEDFSEILKNPKIELMALKEKIPASEYFFERRNAGKRIAKILKKETLRKESL